MSVLRKTLWIFAIAGTVVGSANAQAPSLLQPPALWWELLASVLFGLVGIVLAMVGYKVFEWITPFSVADELQRNHNIAVAIVVAAIIVGICLMMAAVIR